MLEEKDNIEKLISENRDLFQNETMPSGHIKRFESKLNKKNKTFFIPLSPWLAAAAVILVVLLIPLLRESKTEESKGVLSQVSDQYTEVEYYFTSSINNSIGQLDALINSGIGSENDRLMVQEEMLELEERHQQLLLDLKVAPDDERVIDAMIEVYRKKLELINAILNELQEVKKRKEQTYETTTL